jgi:beta-lactamase class A
MLDTQTGRRLAVRADERFAMCSTFKLMLAAATLAQIDAGRWKADDRLTWTAADAVPHMPVTAEHDPRAGMTVVALAEAAQRQSDNLAANLLIRHLGGPPAFQQWLREQGDAVTRMDRLEPAMNRVMPGDARDTTTPAAMAANLVRLLQGPMLREHDRARLLGWMRATRTGLRRLRAGLPAGWVAGDKTGTGYAPGMPDRLNDVAIFWPPGGRAPRVIAAYYEGPRRGSDAIQPRDEAVLAAVGRLATR